ncbi:hypothetical protein NLU13_0787 [Sarocladium strictum]|uniref:Serine/threonine-protein phosphatase 4 regulatory subunit 3-like central domain-containing protein n=1 Tax=Sarocladium strictum TaxID=5046 RepID=A0AA39GQH1_SARSR|nr:hypothetical protein NLU13_0787 [Sarocladium strictum]
MMAQQVPHPATDKKRVKVYELRNNDWFDRGTGFCSAAYHTTEEGRKEPRVFVESEDDPKRVLLETQIQKEDGFQKQQGENPDCVARARHPSGHGFEFPGGRGLRFCLVNGLSDDLAMDVGTTITLPTAELGNLPEIESSIRIMSATANGREALTKAIMTDDYISTLIPLVEMAEDLESLQDLHRLCNIMKQIILLNDTTIIEHAVSDECILGVVGALEYDPDFPSHKANHRQWLNNQGRYKEVVPIQDELTQRKIHQTYRLQYLKDVVLARILDDPTFSVLNSLIFFNQVDIVAHLQTNATFLGDLFAIFNSHFQDEKKRKDAVLLISQCCSIAKNLQPPARQTLYNNFIAHGLMNVINFGLRHADVGVRVGATDILVAVIDHDAHMIKQTIYRQIHEGQALLTDSLVDLLIVEGDLGVKSQITEALKVLLDLGPPMQSAESFAKANGAEFAARQRNPAMTDPQHEVFLTRFYEQSAATLFKPLIDLEGQTDMNFAVQHASMFTYLVELLCFFIRLHHRFSKAFVMNYNLTQRIAQLLKSPEKHLQLLSIRFIRNLIQHQEEFYVKQLLEKRVLSPLLEVMFQTKDKDNLLSSACLELFEHIKKEDIKDFVKYLVVNHRDRLEELSYISTFHEIILRYDQTQGYTANMDFYLEADEEMTRKPPQNARLMEHLSVDPNEEAYWNTSDPEDEDDQHVPADDKSQTGSGITTASKPLVDYPSDEEVEETNEVVSDTPSTEETEAKADDADDQPAPDVQPPERIAEKRRREEEDDDEISKMMQNKRRNSNPTPASNAPAGAGRRRTSFTAGSGNGTPKKIAISLSTALRSGGVGRSGDES